jgi:hypothetical protein
LKLESITEDFSGSMHKAMETEEEYFERNWMNKKEKEGKKKY